MSYRYRFIIAKNEDCLKMRDMTYLELLRYLEKNVPDALNDEDDCLYVGVYDMFKQTEILEMDDNYVVKSVHDNSERFFKLDETEKYFEENEIRFCTKETLKKAIFALRMSILDYYKSILKEEENISVEDKAKSFIHGKVNEWELWSNKFGGNKEMKEHDESIAPYNIKDDVDCIVSSSRYEYLIFEMVRLYKTIDFDNYCLMFYGW